MKKFINVISILALAISLLIVITIGVIHLYPLKPDKLLEQSIQSVAELKQYLKIVAYIVG